MIMHTSLVKMLNDTGLMLKRELGYPKRQIADANIQKKKKFSQRR